MPRTTPETIADHAVDLFLHHDLCCSQAVLIAINRALDLGLDDATLVRLGSTSCGGFGAGGTCGALTGAEMALGLALGPGRQTDKAREKRIRKQAAALHRQFSKTFGTVACRELTRGFLLQKKRRKQNCARYTRLAAALVSELILSRPAPPR